MPTDPPGTPTNEAEMPTEETSPDAVEELQDRISQLIAERNRMASDINSLREGAETGRGASLQPAVGQTRARRDLSLQSLIKPFTGDASGPPVDEFLRNIKLASETGHWEEADRKLICRLKVTGTAATCLDSYPELFEPGVGFAEVERVLRERFGRTQEPQQYLLELMTTTQRPEETARAFADRCRILGQRAMPTQTAPGQRDWARAQMDQTILTSFIRGLKGQAAMMLKLYPPANLEAAIKIGERMEGIVGEPSQSNNANIFAVTDLGVSNSAAAIAQVGTTAPPVSKQSCFACGKPGHFARECRSNRSNRDGWRARQSNNQQRSNNSQAAPRSTNTRGDSRFCFVCGERDHLAFNCSQRRTQPVDQATESRSQQRTRSPNGEGPGTAQ